MAAVGFSMVNGQSEDSREMRSQPARCYVFLDLPIDGDGGVACLLRCVAEEARYSEKFSCPWSHALLAGVHVTGASPIHRGSQR